MRSIKTEQSLPDGFSKIDDASINLSAGGVDIVIPLSSVQLAATFASLGLSFSAAAISMYDDNELADMLPDLEPSWVGVAKAAEMLGVTNGRMYAIIRDGGVDTRTDTGKTLVSVDSINERIANPPRAGRRW